MRHFNWVTHLGEQRFGLTHDLVYEEEVPYLERWICWFGATLRVHKFHKGDDDRAFHDHPWWFITLPLRTYRELTPDGQMQTLKRFVPRFRPAKHQHIVQLLKPQPVWTIIITGPKRKEWGFWEKDKFTHHSLWLEQREP